MTIFRYLDSYFCKQTKKIYFVKNYCTINCIVLSCVLSSISYYLEKLLTILKNAFNKVTKTQFIW